MAGNAIHRKLLAHIAAGICILNGFQNASAQFSGPDILSKAQNVMGPPIQYRAQTNGKESRVYQKVLSDGKLATRIESFERINRVTLVIGSESVELYPDAGVGIDTSFMNQAINSRAWHLGSLLQSTIGSQVSLDGTVARRDRECYALSVEMSPSVQSAVKALGLRMKVDPNRIKYLIDKDTFEMCEMQMLSEAGSVINAIEFLEIEKPGDLPEDLFLVPDGLQLKAPKSSLEYARLLAGIVKSPLTPPTTSRSPRYKFDRKTGKVVVAPDAGISQAEFDMRVAARVAERRAERKGRPTPTPPSTAFRKSAIFISVTLILVALGFLVRPRLWGKHSVEVESRRQR